MPNGDQRRYTGGLVNVDRGLISRDIFTDQGVYEDELERIFPRSWLFVGTRARSPRTAIIFSGRWPRNR